MNKNKKFLKWCIFVLIMVALGITAFFAINHFKPPSIDVGSLSSIRLEVTGLFEGDVNVSIENTDNIQKIATIEKTIWKYRGTSFLIKAKPWNIKIVYHMANGKIVSREYEGQKGITELQSLLSFFTTEDCNLKVSYQ